MNLGRDFHLNKQEQDALLLLDTLLEGEYAARPDVPEHLFVGFKSTFQSLAQKGLIYRDEMGYGLTAEGRRVIDQRLRGDSARVYHHAGEVFTVESGGWHGYDAHEQGRMVIETERLRLRPFRADDLEVYHARVYSDADVMRYLPGGQPRPIEQTQLILNHFIDHQRQHGFSAWVVEEKHSGELVGHCGLVHVLGQNEVELIYALGRDYWGCGYATEAAQAALHFGFDVAHLDRIIALAYPENVASQRVMQKIGMAYQGVTTAYYNSELVLYAQMRREPDATTPALTSDAQAR